VVRRSWRSASAAPRRAEKEKTRTGAVAPIRVHSFDQGSRDMAKPTRRSASTQAQRTVKTSCILAAEVHAKLAALASLRGVPMTSIIAEAVGDAVSSMVVFDRSVKAAKGADSPVQEKESADAA
jgi:hypothetical protein